MYGPGYPPGYSNTGYYPAGYYPGRGYYAPRRPVMVTGYGVMPIQGMPGGWHPHGVMPAPRPTYRPAAPHFGGGGRGGRRH